MEPSSPALSSSSPSCSSLSSSSTRSTCSDASLASPFFSPPLGPLRLRVDPTLHPNAHLAVLLPKHLWKADFHASHCENFYCGVPFSVFERRHHCRNCGGIFCRSCSSRTAHLLDATHLAFLHPLATPIVAVRVCNDCFDQIHHCRAPDLPHAPHLAPAGVASLLSLPSPIALFKLRPPATTSPASFPPSAMPPLPLSAPGSPRALPPSIAPLTRTRPSSHSVSPSTLSRSRPLPHTPACGPERERSWGELDAYPLKRPSVLCKAAGGGRWEPSPHTPDPSQRVPLIGGKAPFELEMEREEAEERRRRSNPVIKDGDFQYRCPPTVEPEPVVLGRPPVYLSTF
ncbi:FYVE zinc finger-domain-containing protein [Mycena belliarum]|uniref:FYVE zinc finger-domain-containing protein n=1 Tax=Mycena belliarum TaxID=1033014 RepID=A0AAD6TUR9_9AGAR|nr:FYVE zinc finger-domain-containing protein [Mycena belliae]